MKVHIYILCFNEEIFIESTINHYRTHFPSAHIVIMDNHSTDRSRDIATEKGCEVRLFETGGHQDELLLRDIRNNIWKDIHEGWVIMCDMDEWLEATEHDLDDEEQKGTTVLETSGYNVTGKSQKSDLSDIHLDDIWEGVYESNMCKRVCFRRPHILDMRYGLGMHTSDPLAARGFDVRLSTKKYVLRHMYLLGLEYLIDKHRRRYERNELGRRLGFYNGHYTLDTDAITKLYDDALSRSISIDH